MTSIPHPNRHQTPHRAAVSGAAGYRASTDDELDTMEIEEAALEHGASVAPVGRIVHAAREPDVGRSVIP